MSFASKLKQQKETRFRVPFFFDIGRLLDHQFQSQPFLFSLVCRSHRKYPGV